MIGLALQGGGARGAYQAGACLAFKKQRIHFQAVCGTSIGSFNGAMVVAHKEKELVELWKTVDMGKVLGYDEKYAAKLKNKEHDLQYYHLRFTNMLHIMRSKGINIQGLEKILRNHLTEEEIRKSKIDFGLCTIRLNKLKPLYIFKDEMLPGKIFDYILASCYLPIFKREKKIDGNYYLDGSFYDSTPINMLIEKGYKKIYVVELNPLININRKPKEDIEIIRISPRRSLGWVVNFDQKSIEENIKMGYYDTLRVIKKLDGYDYCFRKKSNLFYKWLIRKISEKELRHVKHFFNVSDNREVVIKSLEYVMKNAKIDFYQIYNPRTIIKKIQKKDQKDHFVYNFIRKLRVLW